MELNPATELAWIDWEILRRVGIAALIGLALGIDREVRGSAAGMRTHGLVCVSAAAMTVSMVALFHQIGGERADVLRIFEATGAFIGIIGAGLIVFSKGKLRNLTTAAHLWLTAIIGVACGAGQWPLVLICAVTSLTMLTLLRVIEGRLFGERDSAKYSDDHSNEPPG